MREIKAPQQPHLRSLNEAIAHWRCDEASGAALVDVGGSFTTTSGTLPTAAASLITGRGSTGARVFNGTSHHALVAGASWASAALLTNYTIEAWVKPTIGADMCLVAYGGSTELQVGNTLCSLRITAAGLLQLFRERDAGIDMTTTATHTALVTGTTYHVAVVVRAASASTVDIEFFIDGEMVDRVTGQTVSNGGTTSPFFCLGRSANTAEGNLFFNGTLDDVRITSWAARNGTIRDSYSRGIRRFDEATMLTSGQYEVHWWVFVAWSDGAAPLRDYEAGRGYLDLTNVFGRDFLVKVSGSDDIDDAGEQATVAVRTSLQSWNLWASASNPPIDDAGILRAPNRIRIENAMVPLGYGRDAARIFRECVFDGVIAKTDPDEDTVTLSCEDLGYSLRRTWIRLNGDEEHVFSSAPIETVIANMLTTLRPSAGFIVHDETSYDGSITAYFPTSLSWTVVEFAAASSSSVASKIDEVVANRAAKARFKWDDVRKAYRYTVWATNRLVTWSSGDSTVSAAATLDVAKATYHIDDVRNVIDAEGYAGTDPTTGEELRVRELVQDTPSITAYGELYARISLGAAHYINTTGELNDLATRVLQDLREPKFSESRKTLYRRDIELEDIVRCDADGRVIASGTVDRAVVSLSWQATATEVDFEFFGRGTTPVGRIKNWFDLGFIQRGFRPGLVYKPPVAPSGIAVSAIPNGLDIKWDPPVGRFNRRYLETEVHLSTTNGFTPSSSTLRAVVRGCRATLTDLDPASMRYVKILHRDSARNVTALSAQFSAQPRQMPKAAGVHAYRASDYLPGAGKTTIQFATEGGDVFGDYSTGTYTFTASQPGFYSTALRLRCTDSVAFTVTGTLSHVRSGAGSAFLDVDFVLSGTDESGAVSAMQWLDAGDTVKAQITRTTASAAFRIKAGEMVSFMSVRLHGSKD